MKRRSVKSAAACLVTSSAALAITYVVADVLARDEVGRLLAHRPDITVAGVSPNLFTGQMTVHGISAHGGQVQVRIGALRLPIPNVGWGLVSPAQAFPLGGSTDEQPEAAPAPVPVAPAVPAPKATSSNASADDVIITDGPTTYRIKHIDLVETPLSNADLAAMLDPNSAESVETRLRKLTAASITIPELMADSTVGATEQHWAQKQILLASVVKGRAAVGSVGSSDLAVKNGDGASNIEIGSLQLVGIDMGQVAHVYAAGRADDGEKLLPVFDSIIANAIKVTDVQHDQAFTIGSVKEQGFQARALKTDLQTQTRLATTKPNDAATKTFFDDLLGSVSIKLFEVDDVTSVPAAVHSKDDLIGFGLERIIASDVGNGRHIGRMGLKNFHIEGKEGRMALATGELEALSFPFPGTANDASADPKLPSLSKLDLGNLLFDMNVAVKDQPDQRMTFAIDHVSYAAVGAEAVRLPPKALATVDHLTYDVSPNDPSTQTLRALGYKRLDVSSKIASSYDASKELLTIDKFMLSGKDMGSVQLKLDLTNVSEGIVSQNHAIQQASAIAVLFKGVDLVLRNDGLIDKALQYKAGLDGKSVDDERKTYIDFVSDQLPLLAGGSPKLKPLQAALVQFIAAPKTLHVSIATKDGLGAADMQLLGDPNALLDRLEIQATANE